MCLATKMSSKKKAEFKEQTEGWKVLWRINGGLGGDCYSDTMIRPEGEWLHEKGYQDSYYPPSYNNCEEYRYGWHIWLTLDGAKRWCNKADGETIRKVSFKKPVAYGWQRKRPVVVAKEMMILKET